MRNFIVVLVVLLNLIVLSKVDAARLLLPNDVLQGKMFEVTIIPDNSDKRIVINYEAGFLQYMGAVQTTPDIQILNNNALEIKPEKTKFADKYVLKFLPLNKDVESIELGLKDEESLKKFNVVFKKKTGRGYSWVILIVGVFLLFAGRKIWKYQKTAPQMMSTKSLFINYEELEKARKQFDSKSQQETKVTPDTAMSQPKPAATGMIDSISTENLHNNKPTKEVVSEDAITNEIKAVVIEEQSQSHNLPEASQIKINVVLEANGEVYEATNQNIRLGRRKENHIVISASEVSREHAEFFIANDKVMLKAISENNTTKVNGNNIKKEHQIESGDVINLGGTDFVVIKAAIIR